MAARQGTRAAPSRAARVAWFEAHTALTLASLMADIRLAPVHAAESITRQPVGGTNCRDLIANGPDNPF